MKRARQSDERPPARADAGNCFGTAMIEGLALTQIGECLKPGCGAPLFAELLTPSATGRCVECAPRLVEQQEKFRTLFERSGGRLPPFYGRDPIVP